MCLAIPGKIERIDGKKAMVDFGGVKRLADLSFLDEDEISVGDWVLIHVGFAIQRVEEEVARETYRLLSVVSKAELDRELNQT